MADEQQWRGESIRLAQAYNETGNYERAREVVSRCLAENPNDPALLTQYAYAELLLENYASAARSACAALGAAPDDESAMRMYALALDGVGRRYDALWMAYRTVIAHPNSPDGHRLYARLLRKARAFPYALLAVDEALRLDPANVDALITRGSILEDMRRLPESTAAYQEALRLDPSNATALHNIALNELRRGKFAPALSGFLRAAGLDPGLGDLVRSNIAVAFARVIRRVSLSAASLGFLIAFIGSESSKGGSTIKLRTLTGLITVLLIGVLCRLLRVTPRHVLVSLLRKHRFLAARAVHIAVALPVAAWATIVGGPAWIIPAGVFLLISGALMFAWGS